MGTKEKQCGWVMLWLAILPLLAACGTTQQPTATVDTSSAPALPTQSDSAMFTNPVIDHDFPDPDVLKVGDAYYAYATNANSINIQVATSTDLVRWQMLGDALPKLPAWARQTFGLTWAPEVTTYDGGTTFVMYFTARDEASDKQCIGMATSATPRGPFTPQGHTPLICQADEGGSIDPGAFADDDGTRYLLWKNDGNCCAMTTWLYIQPVSVDGLQLQDEPTRLLKRDQVWEGNLIEAPTLWKHSGKYYLFYSANNYAGANYAVGYAVADSILGPYRKPAIEPVLATDRQTAAALGPGGQDIIVGPAGQTWMLYHSWDPTVSYRRMQLDRLTWDGDVPVVSKPSKQPQPMP